MFFSIIIPTYNRAHLISKAIESVLAQTFTDWELLIIDDGSKDNTAEVVRSYADARIRYIYQDNAERSAARNNGITQSKGEFITFLDSDDYYLPERLAGLHSNILKHDNQKALFYTGIQFERKGEIQPSPVMNPADYAMSKVDFILSTVIGNPQVCIHRVCLEQHKYNPAFRIGEDLELWLRIVSDYPLVYIDNEFTFIAIDHEDRSVNEKRYDNALIMRRQAQYFFKAPHPGSQASKDVKQNYLTNCYLSSARHHIYNGRRWAAIRSLLLSLWSQAKHPQTKHKLFLLQKLLTTAKVETLTTYFG